MYSYIPNFIVGNAVRIDMVIARAVALSATRSLRRPLMRLCYPTGWLSVHRRVAARMASCADLIVDSF